MIKQTTILTVLAASLLMTTSSHARDAIIGLSPIQTPEALKVQTERTIQFLANTVQPGEQALIFDAYNVQLIGIFKVPNKVSYANPRAKIQANGTLLKQLKSFIEGSKDQKSRTGSLDLPRLMRTVRENYPSNGNRSFIVLGSPFFDNPLTPSLSMLDGHVPNDGHVASGIAKSPFGTRALGGSLKGTDIHFGLIKSEDAWAVSKRHAYAVERFWTLTAEGHGASTAYFGHDLETLFKVAAHDTPDRRHAAPLGETGKRFMIRFKPDAGRTGSIYDAKPKTKPPLPPVWKSASNVKIAVKWSCESCDLDLHVKPKAESEVISFSKTKTSEGQLYKDFTLSPANNGFETVELKGHFDLSRTLVGVNFYGGSVSTSSVKGEVRIAIGDALWAAPFEIDAKSGNKGHGTKELVERGSAPNSNWIKIDLVEVINSGETKNGAPG